MLKKDRLGLRLEARIVARHEGDGLPGPMEAAMNEISTLATNLPAIIVLSTWLVILSMLVGYSTSSDADRPGSLFRNVVHGDRNAFDEDPNWKLLRGVDPEFSPSWFLLGAQSAYEMIVEAYTRGDVETLRPLLSEQVLDVFSKAIAERKERQDAAELVVFGIDVAKIERVALIQDAIEVEVMFCAQLIETVRSAAGDVTREEPARAIPVADRWTFSRPVPCFDPAWTLVATEGEKEMVRSAQFQMPTRAA